jgi:hypothetical protein
VSSPDLGPSESVQHAANIYARELARGTPLAAIPAMHPAKFGHLTRAELAEARRYGVQANVFRQAVEDLPPNAPVSEVPGYAALPSGGGLWDATVRFAADPSAGERSPQFRTILIASGPGQTTASLQQTAQEEVYGLSDPPTGDEEDVTLVFVPFNTHED